MLKLGRLKVQLCYTLSHSSEPENTGRAAVGINLDATRKEVAMGGQN